MWIISSQSTFVWLCMDVRTCVLLSVAVWAGSVCAGVPATQGLFGRASLSRGGRPCLAVLFLYRDFARLWTRSGWGRYCANPWEILEGDDAHCRHV